MKDFNLWVYKAVTCCGKRFLAFSRTFLNTAMAVILLGLARLKRDPQWLDLENWNWRDHLHFAKYGVTATIRVTEPAALVPVALRLPPGWREVGQGVDSALTYSLIVGNDKAPPRVARLNLLFRGQTLSYPRLTAWSRCLGRWNPIWTFNSRCGRLHDGCSSAPELWDGGAGRS